MLLKVDSNTHFRDVWEGKYLGKKCSFSRKNVENKINSLKEDKCQKMLDVTILSDFENILNLDFS